MQLRNRLGLRFRLTSSFILLIIILIVLWLAGGASQAGVIGQLVTRTATALLLIAAVLLAERPKLEGLWPVAILLAATVVLPLLQLVPLPPSLWLSLPGRALFAEAAQASGQPQPWRPWSIAPGATVNAAASLIVPFTTFILAAGLQKEERARMPTVLIAYITLAMLVGLLQFSGAGFNNPFVNDTPGQVSGPFANRNHFALLLAFGCLIVPAWAFSNREQARWRAPIALSLAVLLVLTILATGSRAGLGLGALAFSIGIIIAWRDIRRTLRRYPSWMAVALIASVIALLLSSIIFSIAADRAISINRLLAVDTISDIRNRARPVIVAMIGSYMPMGSGLGSFDTMFRIHEPLELLKLTYLNHAHNDYLEIALDAGLPGILILAFALGWWAWASVRVWRTARNEEILNARLGSSMLLLIFLASLFDYPARTPVIMAFVVLAAIWLGSALGRQQSH